MSKNIKIELELPEFEKELNISITLKRDGEVVYDTTTPPSKIEKTIDIPKTTEPPKISGSASGNMMNLNF